MIKPYSFLLYTLYLKVILGLKKNERSNENSEKQIISLVVIRVGCHAAAFHFFGKMYVIFDWNPVLQLIMLLCIYICIHMMILYLKNDADFFEKKIYPPLFPSCFTVLCKRSSRARHFPSNSLICLLYKSVTSSNSFILVLSFIISSSLCNLVDN